MWDDATGSVWSHLDGVALGGPSAGRQLEILPLQTTTWGAWVEAYPETTVPEIDTIWRAAYREPVLGRDSLTALFLDTLGELDERLDRGELVIGVLAGAEALAFPIESSLEDAPMQAEVGGVPVVVLEDDDGIPSLAYHRALSDGRVLDFRREGGGIVDVQTGSIWNASGRAVSGELAGVQLTFVTSFFTEWYGWAAFHPETSIYDPA
jgi:hypothetical protein